jgi:hypothetical protein
MKSNTPIKVSLVAIALASITALSPTWALAEPFRPSLAVYYACTNEETGQRISDRVVIPPKLRRKFLRRGGLIHRVLLRKSLGDFNVHGTVLIRVPKFRAPKIGPRNGLAFIRRVTVKARKTNSSGVQVGYSAFWSRNFKTERSRGAIVLGNNAAVRLTPNRRSAVGDAVEVAPIFCDVSRNPLVP